MAFSEKIVLMVIFASNVSYGKWIVFVFMIHGSFKLIFLYEFLNEMHFCSGNEPDI